MIQAWDFVDAAILWSGDEGKSIYSMATDELEISVRSANALKHNNIRTIADLIALTGPEMMRWPNFGRVSLAEIRDELRRYGLKLKPHPDDHCRSYGGDGYRHV